VTAGEIRSTGPLRVTGTLTADSAATVTGTLTAGNLRTSGSLRVDGSLNVIGVISAGNERVNLVSQGGRVIIGGRGAARGVLSFLPRSATLAPTHLDYGPVGNGEGLRISFGANPGDTPLLVVARDVGVGTAVPEARLHVVGDRIRLSKRNDATRFVELRTDGSALDLQSEGGDLFINNNGRRTVIRNLVEQSSLTLKERVADLPDDEAEALLDELHTVTFRYRDDPETVRIGFIAEQMPAMLAADDRQAYRPADVVAVLAAVVRRQQETLARLRSRLAALDAPETS
jgi:hypothetical protein